MITEELYLSESTVKTHTESIYRKFGVHNKQDLIAIADKNVALRDASAK